MVNASNKHKTSSVPCQSVCAVTESIVDALYWLYWLKTRTQPCWKGYDY